MLWYVLAGGAAASWIVGAPTVLAATAVGMSCRGPRWRVSLRGAVRFSAYFVVQSLKGAIDVAGRVLGPKVRIAAGLIEYEMTLLRDPPARDCFVLCVSLLPGTLVASIEGDRVIVHVLDVGAPVAEELAQLERVVAGLFGNSSASDDKGGV